MNFTCSSVNYKINDEILQTTKVKNDLINNLKIPILRCKEDKLILVKPEEHICYLNLNKSKEISIRLPIIKDKKLNFSDGTTYNINILFTGNQISFKNVIKENQDTLEHYTQYIKNKG